MIRALILLFSACWAFLLLLPRARNHRFKEMFRVPRVIPAIVIVGAALIFTLAFLYNYAPQAGDAAFYYGASNRFIHTGTFPQDGHELSLGFVSAMRMLTEGAFGLPLSASIITITFVTTLLYCFAVHRFTLIGTGNRSISLLAVGLAPFSLFTFWFVFGGVYAQFLSLSLFLLGISFYFQRASNWKPALLFALGTIAHVWSGAVFILAFGVFLILARVLKYDGFPDMARRTFKAWGASLFILLMVGLFFGYWTALMGFDHFRPNSLFFSGLGESPILALSAFVGLTVIVARKIPFCLFLFSLALVTSIALFLHGASVVSRAMFLFPIPTIAALGVYRMWEAIRHRWMGFMAIGGLICAVAFLGVHMDKQYVDAQQFSASQTQTLETLNEIQAITEKYGYGNRDIIIVIEDRNYDLRIWTEALTGARVVTEFDPTKDSPREVVYLQSEH